MNVHVASRRVMVVVLSLAAAACSAGESSSGGLEVRFNDQATAADVGLPAYPGSKPYTDPDQSSSAANVRLSTSLFGFRVVGVNLQTPDSPEKVGAFYRQALAKYGDVLECSRHTKSTSEEDGDGVKCDPDDPGANSVVYKVGTGKNQRIVAIKPHGAGARFSLVHLDVREQKR